ncbi:MAG: hypothetical protein R3F47_17615 [Gammaproteobacteria bacterium]
MSGASTEGDWDFSDYEEGESFEAIPNLDPDKGKNSKKNKLDIRRKLEDRLERKRLEDQIGSLDDDWFD